MPGLGLSSQLLLLFLPGRRARCLASRAREGLRAHSIAVLATPGPSLGEGITAFREIETAGDNRAKWDIMGARIR